jgi:hypothetical protein
MVLEASVEELPLIVNNAYCGLATGIRGIS